MTVHQITAKFVVNNKGSNKTKIKLLSHTVQSGQSAGLLTGIKFASNNLIVTLDGDGQNDPKLQNYHLHLLFLKKTKSY